MSYILLELELKEMKVCLFVFFLNKGELLNNCVYILFIHSNTGKNLLIFMLK